MVERIRRENESEDGLAREVVRSHGLLEDLRTVRVADVAVHPEIVNDCHRGIAALLVPKRASRFALFPGRQLFAPRDEPAHKRTANVKHGLGLGFLHPVRRDERLYEARLVERHRRRDKIVDSDLRVRGTRQGDVPNAAPTARRRTLLALLLGLLHLGDHDIHIHL